MQLETVWGKQNPSYHAGHCRWLVNVAGEEKTRQSRSLDTAVPPQMGRPRPQDISGPPLLLGTQFPGPHPVLPSAPTASATISVTIVHSPSHPIISPPLGVEPSRQPPQWGLLGPRGRGEVQAQATKSVHACHQSGLRKPPERK